jgi:hypothetical protein
MMLRPKKLEILKNVEIVKEPIKAKQSHEIKPNPSKDRVIHEGDTSKKLENGVFTYYYALFQTFMIK